MEQGFSGKVTVVGEPYKGTDSWESREFPTPFPFVVRSFRSETTSKVLCRFSAKLTIRCRKPVGGVIV